MNDSSKVSSVSSGLAIAERKTVLLCALWALCSLAAFGAIALLPDTVRVSRLGVSINLLKAGAFAIATVLCWRNAKENSIVSGQIVWQSISVGLGCYALGDITTLLWSLLWGASTTASLSAIFYGASYLFLSIGLFNAVLPRQTSLSLAQSLGIATVGIVGILLASWVNFYLPTTVDTTAAGTSAASSAISAPVQANLPPSTTVNADSVDSNRSDSSSSDSRSAPKLIQTIDSRLAPITRHIGLLYVAGDCILIVMAAALLVAFWGGAYSEAWKLIALAGLCLYVADMLMIYHRSQGSYLPGAFWEILWVLSALFFGLGASVEYGVSTQMRQKRSRQQWI